MTKQRYSIRMIGKMLCRLTPNTKLNTTKRPTIQNIKQSMFMSCSRKQISRGEKCFLRMSGWLGRILLKRCYQTIVIWYAKLAPPSRKSVIACDCVSLPPDNQYPICKSRLENGNLIGNWSLNTMIRMLKHGKVVMKVHILTQTIIKRRTLIHLNLK